MWPAWPDRWSRAALALASTLVFTGAMAGALAPAAHASPVTPILDQVTIAGSRVTGILTAPRAQAPLTVRDRSGEHRLTRQLAPATPVNLVIVADVSGSMAGAPLKAIRDALGSTISTLRSWSKTTAVPVTVTILSFATHARLEAGPTDVSDLSLDTVFSTANPTGNTAIHDAISLAADTLMTLKTPGQGIVVLLSDGADTASRLTEVQALANLAATGAHLLVVPVDSPKAEPAAVARLAAHAGTTATPIDGLTSVLLAIADPPIPQRFTYRGTDPDTRWRLELADGTELEAPTYRAQTPSPATQHPSRVHAPATQHPSRALWAVLTFVGLTTVGCLLARRTARPTIKNVADRLGHTVSRNPEEPSARSTSTVKLAVTGVVVTALAIALLGPIGLGLGPALIFAAVRGVRRLAARRHQKAFDEQLPDALVMLAGALRAGHGLTAALDHTATELKAPAGPALQGASAAVSLGASVAEALGTVAVEQNSSDLTWIAQAVAVQAELGGSLADLVDRVAATVRERQRLRRRVSALSAEGRLSAVILFILPIGLAGVMNLLNPTYLSTLTTQPLGWVMCVVGAVLMVVGGLWMRVLVQVKF